MWIHLELQRQTEVATYFAYGCNIPGSTVEVGAVEHQTIYNLYLNIHCLLTLLFVLAITA